jgi:hypothetical protein
MVVGKVAVSVVLVVVIVIVKRAGCVFRVSCIQLVVLRTISMNVLYPIR